MIYNCREAVERDCRQQKQKLKLYKHLLTGLPKGSLTSYVKKNHIYYNCTKILKGKPKTIYLGSAKSREVQLLQKRYFLEKSIKAMEVNIPLMEKLLKGYKSIDPNEMQKSFPKAYQALPETCFNAAGVFDLKNWGSQPYSKSSKYKEGLRHQTAKGDYVRSKSEVIIANALTARGLEYRYEELTEINGYTKAPDFKIIDPRTGEIIYLEHLGLLSDMEYLKDTLYRLRDYMEDGIIPGVNLILTFDDKDGNIDSLMIERTLDLWFGPAA